MTNYSIGDVLIRLKNAAMVSKKVIEVPKFKYAISVLEVLTKKGFIEGYDIMGREISVKMKYSDRGLSAIQDIKLFSRPGRRWYVKAEEMRPVRSGTGIQIVSTPQGVMTTADAKKQNVGGELICEIW
ncbi:MAG: 30S ribosomal protein S8 [Candidatus Dojkabacteria bacterium]|nr:MAG: 30S ribosomal protein S8 [Candidatus Dojkabacteria bacterium]